MWVGRVGQGILLSGAWNVNLRPHASHHGEVAEARRGWSLAHFLSTISGAPTPKITFVASVPPEQRGRSYTPAPFS